MTILTILIGLAIGYLLVTLLMAYVVHRIPRKPFLDPPDWGTVIDTRIPAADGGSLEVWRIEPDTPSRGIVLLAHGWGRNRDRMVARGRLFGGWGYTVVMHSARDHGRSSPYRFVGVPRFAEDIESVMDWLGRPVILYGHSAGAAAAIIAAERNPQKIELLFLEGCYTRTRKAILSLYRWYNPVFGRVFGPMIVQWLNLFYRGDLDRSDPVRLAPHIRIPVMVIHGKKDRRFPIGYARKLKNAFNNSPTVFFIARGAEHSESSHAPGYRKAVKRFLDRHAASDDKGAVS